MSELIKGSGGGKSGSQAIPVETPDNLVSDDFATILDLVSEGEIEGLVAGLKSIYFDDVPLQNPDGSFNFDGVTVETRLGTAGQVAIGMIAGTESENGVGVEVEQAVPISRSIVNPDVDRVRVTIGVPALSYQNEKNGNIEGSFVEYKISVSSAGGSFVDAGIGGGSWTKFTGNFTPAGTKNFRAAVRYTPNSFGNTFTAKVRLEYRSGSDPWVPVGEEYITGNGVFDVIEASFNLTGYATKFFEVIGLSPAVYELRAVLVSTTESTPGTVSVVSQATGLSNTLGRIEGKTTSLYKKSHVINLKAFGSSPYVIKVTRLTPDSTKTVLQNKIRWESYTEIIDEKFRYPHSALVATRISSKQFPSIPTRGFHIRGIKVKVPSNYDPINRTYTGTWDGLFSIKWTDNPAWIFYDLCTNKRYGAGEYIDSALIDKWALYSIAQYCDEMVPNGKGGYEPRYTCNMYLQEKDSAYKVLTSIASIFRGMIYWSAGAIVAVADRPQDPIYMYTAANVEDGKFVYSGTNIRTRKNVALVTWNDPTDRFRQKVEYVPDEEAIAELGYVNETAIYAVGCTSQGQAHRVGRWLTYTERFENELVGFSVGLDGNIPNPGDLVYIRDPLVSGRRLGGRVQSGSTTSIIVDKALEVGPGYTVSVLKPSGGLETRELSNTLSTTDTLTVSTPFSFAPEPDTIWIVSTPSTDPVLFKVISVIEEEGGEKFSVTGLRHYAQKFDLVEQNLSVSIPNFEAYPNRYVNPSAPTGLTISEAIVTAVGSTYSKVVVSWNTPAPSPVSVNFEASYKINQNNWIILPRNFNTSFDVTGVEPGDEVFIRVFAVNERGARSDTVGASILVVGVDMDDLLTPQEKNSVIQEYDALIGEQAGIDAQADTYSIVTEKLAYDTSLSNLTAYLATLTLPVAWNDLTGSTSIVGTTFRSMFQDVYLAKQELLNRIATESSNFTAIVEGPSNVNLYANYLGVFSEGQLPKTIAYIRKKGSQDVSASTTWSIVAVQGVSTGSIAISAAGVVTLPADLAMAATATYTVRSERDGVLIDTVVTITKSNSAPPSTGTGGGSTVSDSTFNGVTGNSFVAISDLMSVRTSSAGTINFSAPLTTSIVAGSGTFPVEIVWRYRPIGGSFSDVGTPSLSSPSASGYLDVEFGEYFSEDGYVTASPTLSGLAADTNYEVQLFGRRTTTIFPSRVVYFTGTATAVGGSGSSGSGAVSTVGVSAPLTSTGGSTPTISMPVATASQDGYLDKDDFVIFNNKLDPSGNAASSSVAASVDNLNSASNLKFWTGTQAQYDAIVTKDPNTQYAITDAPAIVSDRHFRHVQGSASNEWIVDHNLGKYPSITVVDSGGSIVEGECVYTTLNQVKLTFIGSFAGEAFLN